MVDRPIIFLAPTIQALLAGRKTQTRRLLSLPKWASTDPADLEVQSDGSAEVICRDTGCLATVPMRFAVGDQLWVREKCQAHEQASGEDRVYFPADEAWKPIQAGSRGAADSWLTLYHYGRRRGAVVPSIHMPRWASRLTLVVTGVRLERLNAMSPADAIAEGIRDLRMPDLSDFGIPGLVNAQHPVRAFWLLWDSIYGEGAWLRNP